MYAPYGADYNAWWDLSELDVVIAVTNAYISINVRLLTESNNGSVKYLGIFRGIREDHGLCSIDGRVQPLDNGDAEGSHPGDTRRSL